MDPGRSTMIRSNKAEGMRSAVGSFDISRL